MKRKTSIELMRFFGATMVVFVHCRGFIYEDSILAPFAYPVVDFFFMISGYFGMKDASKHKPYDSAAVSDGRPDAETSDRRIGAAVSAQDAILYSWRKAKDLFGLYVFALILMFVIRTAQKDVFSLAETCKELFHFKWEFFMLHMLGFNAHPAFDVDYLLAPGWFVSSLMIALVPFYFLARRFGKTFSGVIAPVGMVLLYAYFVQTYGSLDIGNEVAFGAVMVGNLRAFAGLSAGAFVFRINEWVGAYLQEKKVNLFFGMMDVIAWALAISLFVFPKDDLIPEADMIFWMVPFAFLLLNGLNDIGCISHFLNHHGSAVWSVLGKLSMYVFLLHMPVIFIWQKHVQMDAPVLGSVLIFCIALAFGAVVMLVREKIK